MRRRYILEPALLAWLVACNGLALMNDGWPLWLPVLCLAAALFWATTAFMRGLGDQ